MKLHILSDLHLGHGALELPRVDADVVILAGDIGRPGEAIAWAQRFEVPVLYVAGNHEFYGGSIPGRRHELRRLSADTRIRVLDDDALVIDGVRFLGTTLWTDQRLFSDAAQRAAGLVAAQRYVYDYTRICSDLALRELFSPAAGAALFDRHARWLAARLAEPFPGPTVVITHHAPSPQSIHPRFADSLLNPCFVSDASHLLSGGRARLWVHGHTHDSFDYQCDGTRVVCNPRGYVLGGVTENPCFDPGFVVEIA